MHIILVFIVAWMISTEKGRNKVFALFIFFLSGVFGMISLNMMPSDQALFPALSGLFGLSTLVISVLTRVRIPRQKKQKEIKADWVKGSLTGWLAGMLAGLLPGIGSSQAGIIASRILRARRREFLISLGGINTSNIFFTFLVFYLIGKTRSGAVWLISQITESLTSQDVLILIFAGAFSCFISALLALKLGGALSRRITSTNYTKIMIFTIAFITAAIFAITGFIGLLVLITGVFIGLLATAFGIKRTNLMGFLLLPTIAYFSGLNPVLLGMLW